MAANLSPFLGLLEILEDDTLENDFLADEKEELILFSASSAFTRGNLNRTESYFELSVPSYSLDEFKSHFPHEKEDIWSLVNELIAIGNIWTGNLFGQQAIDPGKQVLLFIWSMANQETMGLADRFDVSFSSLTRIIHEVTILAVTSNYIKWPNGLYWSFLCCKSS